jgi:hypothetical protein
MGQAPFKARLEWDLAAIQRLRLGSASAIASWRRTQVMSEPQRPTFGGSKVL